MPLGAIEALIDNTHAPFELIVVDNASSDGTAARESGLVGARSCRTETTWGSRPLRIRAPHSFRPLSLLSQPTPSSSRAGSRRSSRAFERNESVGAVAPLSFIRTAVSRRAGSAVDSNGAALSIGDGGDPSAFEHRFGARSTTAPPPASSCPPISSARSTDSTQPTRRRTTRTPTCASSCMSAALRPCSSPASHVVHVRGWREPAGARAHENQPQDLRRALGRAASTYGARSRRPEEPTHRPCPPRRRSARPDPRDRRSRAPLRPWLGRSADGEALAELVDLWPEARITFFASIRPTRERYATPLLERGIEVACATERFDLWFDRRRYHYSVVLLSRASNIEHFERHLRRTQPQARRIYDIEALAFRRYEHETARKPRGCASSSSKASREPTSSSASLSTRRRSPASRRTCPSTFSRRTSTCWIGRRASTSVMASSSSAASWRARSGPNEDAAVAARRRRHAPPLGGDPDLRLEIVGANPTAPVRELQRPLVDVVGFVPIRRSASHARASTSIRSVSAPGSSSSSSTRWPPACRS